MLFDNSKPVPIILQSIYEESGGDLLKGGGRGGNGGLVEGGGDGKGGDDGEGRRGCCLSIVGGIPLGYIIIGGGIIGILVVVVLFNRLAKVSI